MVSFAVQKLVSLIRSHLFIFAFISVALGNRPKKTSVRFMSENVLPMFSARRFSMSCLIFKSLSHSEFIFLHGVRMCSSFTDLHATLQLSQHPSLHKETPGAFLGAQLGLALQLPLGTPGLCQLQLLLRLRGGSAGCGSSESSQAVRWVLQDCWVLRGTA